MVVTLLRYRSLFIFTASIALFASCTNSPEVIPSYIHIDKISFIPTDTTPQGQGSASANISDAWVSIDDKFVGTYELPCTFPVQYAGAHTIKIGAGIKVNGIGATRVVYPFYTYYSGSVNLTAKEITTVTPSVKYYTAVSFPYVEDFEGIACAIDTFGEAKLRIVGSPGAWGSGKSAHVKLSGDTI